MEKKRHEQGCVAAQLRHKYATAARAWRRNRAKNIWNLHQLHPPLLYTPIWICPPLSSATPSYIVILYLLSHFQTHTEPHTLINRVMKSVWYAAGSDVMLQVPFDLMFPVWQVKFLLWVKEIMWSQPHALSCTHTRRQRQSRCLYTHRYTRIQTHKGPRPTWSGCQ